MRSTNVLSVYNNATWLDGPSITTGPVPWIYVEDGANSIIRVYSTETTINTGTSTDYTVRFLGSDNANQGNPCGSPLIEYGYIPEVLSQDDRDKLMVYLSNKI
jgi:hypothetical protein